ncbi:hypothetical protein [Marinibactrum halimedae]|uniref:hypothetical protein n=1 Tax=Marinibactrum halimedae TaxID=1444977 RepID=UPI001E4AD087|nr:hypothetical protein [Marinibactrum halimedae]MCD9459661.1 hypothetical protein [Marinibactrum halimedae]
MDNVTQDVDKFQREALPQPQVTFKVLRTGPSPDVLFLTYPHQHHWANCSPVVTLANRSQPIQKKSRSTAGQMTEKWAMCIT